MPAQQYAINRRRRAKARGSETKKRSGAARAKGRVATGGLFGRSVGATKDRRQRCIDVATNMGLQSTEERKQDHLVSFNLSSVSYTFGSMYGVKVADPAIQGVTRGLWEWADVSLLLHPMNILMRT